MVERKQWGVVVIAAALAAGLGVPATAQIVQESFNTVTGTGGGTILTGAGFNWVNNWDNGIVGENAFAGTTGNAKVTAISAAGVTNGGVGSTGAGRIQVAGASFELLDQDFSTVTGVGGGVFLAPNGTPNTTGFSTNWDTGITGEGAWATMTGGAEVVGGVSALGCLTCGAGGGGGGSIAVSNINLHGTGNWDAGLTWSMGPFPGALPVYNPGFEDGAVGYGAASWTAFNNAYTAAFIPRTGTKHLKLYGSDGGVYQNFPAAPGESWTAGVWALNPGADHLANMQRAVINIEWHRADGGMISYVSQQLLDVNSPWGYSSADYVHGELTATAPAETTTARLVLITGNWGGAGGGAAYYDDVTFRKNAASPVNLANYQLLADVKGTANTGAGEQLGNYQLRIEDADGDRLVFFRTANGNWQTNVGGLLSAPDDEQTAAGVSSNGVFDVDSAKYSVVLAFDNQPSNTWNAGGTLTVDNLVINNTDPAGSAWYAGLFWNNLQIPTGEASRLFLSADVLGTKAAGEYELRLECNVVNSSGINENFATVTGTGGGLFLDYDASTSGVRNSFTPDWDGGIAGEAAFGGLGGDMFQSYLDVWTENAGFSARGCTDCGMSGGAGAELKVDGVIWGPGGSWYAGLQWGGQLLASTDLSQVVLSADIKGTEVAGGGLGAYELRIEDAQGDRMYFPVTANGSWQHVGGALSTATEGGKAGGGGDGTFDLDSPSYTVVIAFEDIAPWGFGGILAVDNLYLTAATLQEQIGTVSFHGVANGSTFQNIGGLLSTATSSFRGDLNESFNTVTGTGGGLFLAGTGSTGGIPWDDGIAGEFAFAGTWGDAVVNTGFTAQGCTSCGVSGTGAGQIIVSNVVPSATGGWWAGLNWPGYPVNLKNLSQVYLTAKIKGTANTGAGESLGRYTLRLEDPQTDFLAFDMVANGTFQTVGGPLSTAVAGSTPNGDGSFDLYAAAYTVTVVFEGTPTNWGPGGTLTVEDLHLDGINIGDAETYSVTLTFDNEVATWGTDGTLRMDNLMFTAAANCDGDNDVDLKDFATFQACFGKSGTLPAGCACADLDGDHDVDLADYKTLGIAFKGPQ